MLRWLYARALNGGEGRLSATDFNLAADLEALLQLVCKERGIAPREHDALRTLLQAAPEQWPVCCRGECHPCVDEQVRIARDILTRFAQAQTPIQPP